MSIEGDLPSDPGERVGRRDIAEQTAAMQRRFSAPSEGHRKTIAERTNVPVFGKHGEPLNTAARRQVER